MDIHASPASLPELDEFLATFQVRFRRPEGKAALERYLTGLLTELPNKNCDTMAEAVPGTNEQRLQEFLTNMQWDEQDLNRQRVAKMIAEATVGNGVLLFDDTGFAKQGKASVGVARQYSGTLGKVGNCQLGVFLSYVSARGHALVDKRLYLTPAWSDDPARCRAAGIPDTVGFRPNWQLAVELIDQALAWGLPPPPAVLADSAYGEVTAFREALQARQLAYAVGISKALAVWPESPGGAVPNGTGRGRPRKCMRFGGKKPVSVQELALAHRKRFRTVTWREGSHGRLTSRFWAQRVESAHDWNHGKAPGKEVWLLVEWPADEPGPVKYYLCDLPKDMSLRRLVATARGRWRVEQDYQQMKEELGLDHFEGRSWTGWHHHVTMVMLAHLFLRLEQKRRASKSTLDAAASAP